MTPIETAITGMLLKQAEKYVLGDQPDIGKLTGAFTLEPITSDNSNKQWSYLNNGSDPMRFIHEESGYEFATGFAPFDTDLGSIPNLVQKFAPEKYLQLKEDDFPEAFAIHDFACRNGWLWVRKNGGIWARMPFSKIQADVMLFWVLSTKSPTTGKEANRLTAQAIYRAVRAFHATQGK